MRNKGVWFAVGCYAIWGLFPIYWKQLQSVPAVQIVAHRLSWSLVFLLILVIFFEWRGRSKEQRGRGIEQQRRGEEPRGRGEEPRGLLAAINGRTLAFYALAGFLLTINWLVYIYGVNAGFVVETSLGYFINPLVSVLFGVIIFREKLSTYQWIPIALAAAGVLYLTISYGQLPWISLALAISFGLYGLVKKLSPLGALQGLTLETAAMFIPALAYLLFVESQGTGAFGHATPLTTTLLILAGPVTAVPLLLFSSAARSIPLSTIGLLQYITPTSQFLLGVFAYGEPFTHDRLIGFGIIWVALAIFSLGGLYERRRVAV